MAQPLRLQDGLRLRRQLVIGPYIVDFACTKVRLVVEVDGGYHEGRARPDGARDRALGRLGWHVLRVREEEVLQDIETVVRHMQEVARLLPSVRGAR